jgi:hypothetical protein
MMAGFFLMGIVFPILLLVFFIWQVRDKKDPNRSPFLAFIYFVVMGGGLGYGAYYCSLQLPTLFSIFLEGFSRFLF